MTETRIALVTGANRGIGLEIVRQLGRLGVIPIIAARDPDKGNAASASVRSEGLECPVVELDVNDDASVENGVMQAMKLFGRIDILVNNAGILIDRDVPASELPSDMLAQSLATNVLGPLRTMRAVLPVMKERNYGRIVNMSSILGQLQSMAGGRPAYRVSKTALNALTRTFAAEVGPGNIKINSMHPGWIKTDMGGNEAPLSVAEGADTAVWLATLDETGPSGGFFEKRTPIAW